MRQIPQGKKLVYDKVDISIASGDSSFAKNLQLRQGHAVGVKIIEFSSLTKTTALNVLINDTNGSALVGATDYRDFIPLGGGYEAGYKPVSFSTNPTIDISLVTATALTGDFDAQIIFAIEVDDSSSN
jgi:hypothetical protein